MSFWLDDDDGAVSHSQKNDTTGQFPSQRQLSQGGGSTQLSQSQQQLVCGNCGGTDFYEDTEAGSQICRNCFTQSQHALSQELDYEQVMTLAAKTRSGTLVQHRIRRKAADGAKVSKRLPLEDVDQSRPLPNLETCLVGLTTVLQQCSRILAHELMKLDEATVKNVQSVTRMLWVRYLRAWQDGAQHYGPRHATIRFCLRDTFLSRHHVRIVMQHLTYQAQQRVAADGTSSSSGSDDKSDNEVPATNNAAADLTPTANLSEDSFRNSEVDERETFTAGAATKEPKSIRQNSNQDKTPKLRNVRPIEAMLRIACKHQPKGGMECALLLQPSLTFAASLLFMSVLPMGLPMYKMHHWMANGALPLCRAWTLLSAEQQSALTPAKAFFTRADPPPMHLMEWTCKLLAIACQSSKTGVWQPPTLKPTGITIPHLVTHLCADAGVGQRVLDMALALLGRAERTVTAGLPAPLVLATHDEFANMKSTTHVTAVVFCACELCGGPAQYVHRTGSKRQKLIGDRHVPLNDADFRRFLRHDACLDGYLKYLEDNVVYNESRALPLQCLSMSWQVRKSERDEGACSGDRDVDPPFKQAVSMFKSDRVTSPPVQTEDEPLNLLRGRILAAQRPLRPQRRPRVPLSPEQQRLLEFFAALTGTSVRDLENALRSLI